MQRLLPDIRSFCSAACCFAMGASLAAVPSTVRAAEPLSNAQLAALAFRAVATEATRIVEPVLLQMPEGLESRSSGWPSAAQAAWKIFFASSVVHVGFVGSSQSVFAYYNPFSDVAVLGVWEFPKAAGSKPQVKEICAVPAELLRGVPSPQSPVPSWLQAKDPLAGAQTFVTDTLAALEKRFPHAKKAVGSLPPGLCSAEHQKMAEFRLYQVLDAIETAAKTGVFDPVSKLATAADQGPEAVGKAFARLSKTDVGVAGRIGSGFARLAPAVALGVPDHQTYILVLAHAASGRRFVSLTLSNEAGAWTVTHLVSWRFGNS